MQHFTHTDMTVRKQWHMFFFFEWITTLKHSCVYVSEQNIAEQTIDLHHLKKDIIGLF